MARGLIWQNVRLFLSLVFVCFTVGCAAGTARQSWIASQGGVCDCTEVRRARAVANALGVGTAHRSIEVHVLAREDLAAYSWPDGAVFVTRGLVRQLDDQELAAAIAHELGHLEGNLPVALKGNGAGLQIEERADDNGVELLRKGGAPASAMPRMLRKIVNQNGLTPAVRSQIQERIRRLEQSDHERAK